MQRKSLIGIVAAAVLSSSFGLGYFVRSTGLSLAVTDCTAQSTYACMKFPGTSSGAAIITVSPDAGNPVLTWPTQSGTLLTEERARQLFAPLSAPTPTPTPAPSSTPTPVPTSTPTPTPRPTPNPISISPPSFAITENFGVADTTKTQFNVTAPGAWTASVVNPTQTPWIQLHCVTGACGGSFFAIQIMSASLQRGTYNGTVTVKSGSATQTLNVTLTVQ